MSLQYNSTTLLGKRKRVCEACARSNLQCDLEEASVSSCRACVAAGITCSALSNAVASATGQPPPVSWHQPSPASGSLSLVSDHSPKSVVNGARLSSQHGIPRPRPVYASEKSPVGRIEASPRSPATVLSRITAGGGEDLAVKIDLGVSSADVPLWAAASFFRTYFTIIHSQYPFLDIETCAVYYTQWKASLLHPEHVLDGWPGYFVNMILAIGSLIESKSECSPYPQYQALRERSQVEHAIIADSTTDPLIRLQALLLSAMYALHAETTWRIAHLSGVVMKFASLHRFHRLTVGIDMPADSPAIRVWSCVYAFDRVVSSGLFTPVSLPDMYITSPLIEAPSPELERAKPQPWLADCVLQETPTYTDLRTFAHVCKIRKLMSFFLHVVEKDELDNGIPKELELHMSHSLRELEDSSAIATHSVKDNFGYQSPLWLRHVCSVVRLSIFTVHRSNMASPTADAALDAACAVCTSFRSLQKKKKMAQPWLVVIVQFRAVITLIYIVWAKAIPLPRQVNDAFCNCSAVLAIFADRWPRAELYRDCFELLAKAIPRCQPLGFLSPEVKSELLAFTCKLEESGIHRTTSRMLREMFASENSVLAE